MAHARNAPKRPLNVSLNEDLVRLARPYSCKLSGTLQDPLRRVAPRRKPGGVRLTKPMRKIIQAMDEPSRQV
jgi:hypothetical protein